MDDGTLPDCTARLRWRRLVRDAAVYTWWAGRFPRVGAEHVAGGCVICSAGESLLRMYLDRTMQRMDKLTAGGRFSWSAGWCLFSPCHPITPDRTWRTIPIHLLLLRSDFFIIFRIGVRFSMKIATSGVYSQWIDLCSYGRDSTFVKSDNILLCVCLDRSPVCFPIHRFWDPPDGEVTRWRAYESNTSLHTNEYSSHGTRIILIF